jgi:HSP20 family protein
MAGSGKQEVEISTEGKAPQRAMPMRLMHPFDEFEQMFDRLFGRSGLRPWSWTPSLPSAFSETLEGRLPAVDMVDRDDEIVVRAEVPGVDKKDLDVSMTDNTLTIKGSTSHEDKEQKGDYYRCEISRGAFARIVTLPCNVDASKVKAALKDGVLEIILPKAEKSKRQSIAVS